MAAQIVDDVSIAAACLKSGGLVGMPTETVYGLAADATNQSAVARIYDVKGRPEDHPVIVHAQSFESAMAWAASVPDWATQLALTFWPGPLTLILPRARHVGDYLTGGQETVGLRVPGHRLALALLAEYGSAVAAPSANRFGKVSPTSAADVEAELGSLLDASLDCILDGGRCPVGVESTIVDATGDRPTLLRPGAVSQESIEMATSLGVEPATRSATRSAPGSAPGSATGEVRAPGMLASHYAPQTAVLVAEPHEVMSAIPAGISRVGGLALADQDLPPHVERLASPRDAAEFAAVLYATLRRADELSMDVVLVVPPPDLGIGVAVRDRVSRAATTGWSG